MKQLFLSLVAASAFLISGTASAESAGGNKADGYISITIPNSTIVEGGKGFVRKNSGVFEYCLEYNLSTFSHRCTVYGSAEKYIYHNTGVKSLSYVDMDVERKDKVQIIYLYYKM